MFQLYALPQLADLEWKDQVRLFPHIPSFALHSRHASSSVFNYICCLQMRSMLIELDHTAPPSTLALAASFAAVAAVVAWQVTGAAAQLPSPPQQLQLLSLSFSSPSDSQVATALSSSK